MQRQILAILAVVALVGCSSTRNTPCEVLDAQARQGMTQNPYQAVDKTDALTGAALADSDGDATLSNQKVGVDVQSPNQATGAQFSISPLLGENGGAAGVLTQTFPGEKAVLARLESNERASTMIRSRLATDPTLTAEEKAELEARLDRLDAQGDALIERLDAYAAQKIAAAKALVPDLSALRSIVYLITSHQTAGNDVPNITDAQADAIARVAERAVSVSPTAEPE